MKMNVVLRYVLPIGLALALCGCRTSEKEEEEILRVLMIGNSFSICVLEHLPQIAKEQGVNLDIASLYIGGCTLKRHWRNATNAVNLTFRPYRYDRIVNGKRTIDGAKRNVLETVAESKWDIVTVQQGSHDSWRPASYHPYGDNLVAKIRDLSPQAKIWVQETWSYTPWDDRFAKWGIGQNEMYQKLHAAYLDFASGHGFPMIPFGTAVQEWRRKLPVKYTENSFGGDVVGGGEQDAKDCFKRDADNRWRPNCDVCHLNGKGEYFQALVWAKHLLGVNPLKVIYRPPFVTDDEASLMKEIAAQSKSPHQ